MVMSMDYDPATRWAFAPHTIISLIVGEKMTGYHLTLSLLSCAYRLRAPRHGIFPCMRSSAPPCCVFVEVCKVDLEAMGVQAWQDSSGGVALWTQSQKMFRGTGKESWLWLLRTSHTVQCKGRPPS
jgi:hypothetical protein